jgi:hypothetical protein
MTYVAELSLSVRVGPGAESIASLLRDPRLPAGPTAVKRDGERIRCWWLVDVSNGRPSPQGVAFIVAPYVWRLFQHQDFDARWRLKDRPDMTPSE